MIIILGLILIAAARPFGHRPVHQQASAGLPAVPAKIHLLTVASLPSR
jgi:hypothetical protein